MSMAQFKDGYRSLKEAYASVGTLTRTAVIVDVFLAVKT